MERVDGEVRLHTLFGAAPKAVATVLPGSQPHGSVAGLPSEPLGARLRGCGEATGNDGARGSEPDKGGNVDPTGIEAAARGGAAVAKPRVLAYAERGIRTGRDFAGAMSALMSDLIDGRVDARTAGAICAAGHNLLAVVKMEHQYGKATAETEPTMRLAP